MVKPNDKTSRLKPSSPETSILSAARSEFIKHGLRGARMQAIADRCNVNKALLHYYFRSKERLYEAVLQDMMQTLLGAIRQQLPREDGGDDLRSLLRLVVTTYIKTLQQNPEFPRFILREIVEGGDHLPVMVNELLSSFGDIPLRIHRLLIAHFEQGAIRQVDPVQFALNVLGMCIFTFIARPIVGAVNERVDLGIRFDDVFFDRRIEAILDMVFYGLFKEQRP